MSSRIISRNKGWSGCKGWLGERCKTSAQPSDFQLLR